MIDTKKLYLKTVCYKIILCLVVLSVLLCSCKSMAKESYIKIGVNIELTGRLAQYGRSCQEGIELALSEINERGGVGGKKIKLVYCDNRSENSDAAMSMLRLRDLEKAVAVIGPTTSGGVKSALSVGGAVPIITPSATANELGRGEIFRICYTDSVQGEVMGEYAYKSGYKKAAMIIDSASDYSRGTSQSFIKSFKALGGEITDICYYTAKDSDFSVILTKIANKSPSAIYLPGYYSEAAAIIRQARQIGITATFLSGDAFDSPELAELCGGTDNLEGITYTNHMNFDSEREKQFSDSFTSLYGHQPQAYSALGYDALYFIVSGLKSIESREFKTLSESLYNIKDFSGITGSFSIDKKGNAEKKVVITRIENGEKRSVVFKG